MPENSSADYPILNPKQGTSIKAVIKIKTPDKDQEGGSLAKSALKSGSGLKFRGWMRGTRLIKRALDLDTDSDFDSKSSKM